MFVNKITFLVSISRGPRFTTIEYLSCKNKIALVSSINKKIFIKNHMVNMYV